MSVDGGNKWISRGNRRELCRTGVMTMVSETFECVRTGAVHDFITVDLIDWVVIVAETPEKELVMIRQFRHGSGRVELEVPGGCIDRKDSDPLEASIPHEISIAAWNGSALLDACFIQNVVVADTCVEIEPPFLVSMIMSASGIFRRSGTSKAPMQL